MNARRFHQVLRAIEANPSAWQQYSCLDCFLAHANRILGGRGQRAFPAHRPLFEEIQIEPSHIPPELDLTKAEANWLYRPKRTLDELRTLGRTLHVGQP